MIIHTICTTYYSFIWVDSCLILVDLPGAYPSDSPNKWYQSRWFVAWESTVWPCIESLSDGDFRQACPV